MQGDGVPRPSSRGASAVVTGAGQGIGAAIAKGLAAAGRTCRPQRPAAATLDAVCEAIRAEGGSADYCVGDVTDLAHLDELMATAAGERGMPRHPRQQRGHRRADGAAHRHQSRGLERDDRRQPHRRVPRLQGGAAVPAARHARQDRQHRLGHRQATAAQPHALRGGEARRGRADADARARARAERDQRQRRSRRGWSRATACATSSPRCRRSAGSPPDAAARRDDRGHGVQAHGQRGGRRRRPRCSSAPRRQTTLTGQDINVAAGAVMY